MAISVYKQKINNNITIKDEESMKKYVDLIQWGRAHPIQFIEQILGITLLDYQKWLVAETWTKEEAVWAMSRNAGKSFLVGIIVMLRNLLFPKLKTMIVGQNWTTSNDTFKKMEDIATNNIKTIINTNTVFIDELKKTKSDSDGFTHDAKNGSKCELLNGSTIQAVAGSSKSARGKRSNFNIYDEAGFILQETFTVTEPYMAQNAGFKLGSSYDADVYPQDIPNLKLYIGSASDTNSHFYAKYKECAIQMIIGSDKYFVADLSCEVPKHPTSNGEPVAPLLSQDEIDRAMRDNEIKAMREYYNIFDHFDLEDCVVSRSDILSNTEVFAPIMMNNGEKYKYVISYDPASKVDNAPVVVMQVSKTKDDQIVGRIVHLENLVIAYNDGSKRPMRVDEQVQKLRELMLAYNGRTAAPYENVIINLDNGVGGQSSAICQELCKEWKDQYGKKHPGIYDENDEYSVRWAETYPTAISGVLRLLEPRKLRNLMFESAKVLVPQGAIIFSPPCPKYDTLVFDDGTERKLGKNEMNSLIQMDLMKEEITSMVRCKTPGGTNVTYQLPPEKRNRMHDDRAYAFVMCAYALRLMRDDDEFGDGREIDYSHFTSGVGGETSVVRNNSFFEDPWLKNFTSKQNVNNKTRSPFTGISPFKK